MKIALALLLTSFSCVSFAQATPLEEQRKANSMYVECLNLFAKAYASTSELPGDIADAALSYCDSLGDKYLATIGADKMRGEDRARLAEWMQKERRRTVIEKVLEQRYPGAIDKIVQGK